jgi:hypothetical protein
MRRHNSAGGERFVDTLEEVVFLWLVRLRDNLFLVLLAVLWQKSVNFVSNCSSGLALVPRHSTTEIEQPAQLIM